MFNFLFIFKIILFFWVYSCLKAGLNLNKFFLQIQTFLGIHTMFKHITTKYAQQLHVWVSCYHGNRASLNKLLKSTLSLRKKWAKITKLNDLKIVFADSQYECLWDVHRTFIYFKYLLREKYLSLKYRKIQDFFL